MRENFSLISYSQMKLCLYKVTKSDACIRPIFANPVTYEHVYFLAIRPILSDQLTNKAKPGYNCNRQDISRYCYIIMLLMISHCRCHGELINNNVTHSSYS